MVGKTGFFPGDPEDPGKKDQNGWNYSKGVGPKDRAKDRRGFTFGSNKFADWSEEELKNYLKFLNNPPKPEDLEERPEGGYRP